MDIVAIGPDDFPAMADALSWHFESFAERSGGEETADNLRAGVLEGKLQCWIAWDGDVKACALTTILISGIRVVELIFCAGRDRADWQGLLVSHLEEWTRKIDGKRFRIVCRPGHSKFLKSAGYRETHRIMERDIG